MDPKGRAFAGPSFAGADFPDNLLRDDRDSCDSSDDRNCDCSDSGGSCETESFLKRIQFTGRYRGPLLALRRRRVDISLADALSAGHAQAGWIEPVLMDCPLASRDNISG